jgi:hypothetical protein
MREGFGDLMEILSHADGSASAVRNAATVADDGAGDARMALERELDRLNGSLSAAAHATAQHANWTLLAQAFLLTSYLIVLVAGWNVPLPGKRWLLAAIAGYAILSLLLGMLAQRGTRDRIFALRASRKVTEEALERVAGRPPVFSRDRTLSTIAADWAARLGPVLIVTGWVALGLYTTAVPFPTDTRLATERRGESRPADARSESRNAATPATAARTPAAAAKAPPRKAEEVSSVAAAEESPAPEAESPLATFLRRAINTPRIEQDDVR